MMREERRIGHQLELFYVGYHNDQPCESWLVILQSE